MQQNNKEVVMIVIHLTKCLFESFFERNPYSGDRSKHRQYALMYEDQCF